jgi:hypothetical protein
MIIELILSYIKELNRGNEYTRYKIIVKGFTILIRVGLPSSL